MGYPERELIAGRYRVVRRLGAGATGEVFEVEHPSLPRREAVKVLNPRLSGDPDFKSRFLREAGLMASLVHPNIVTVFDRGEDDQGRMWLAMELVDGIDAGEMVHRYGPMPTRLVVDIVAGTAAALDYAWRTRQINHRDVKPSNILLGKVSGGRVETVKLADFGIAKAADGPSAITATGMTVGTVEYMAPEALEGTGLTGAADQYSLACTAFALLTGRSPFAGTSKAAIMTGHLSGPIPSITARNQALPEQLNRVFARALAKRPENRFANCREFADAMRAALGEAPTQVHQPTERTMPAATQIHSATTEVMPPRPRGPQYPQGDWYRQEDPYQRDDPYPPPESIKSAERLQRRYAGYGVAGLVITAVVVVVRIYMAVRGG